MNKIVIAKIVAYFVATIAAVSSYGHQVYLLTLADLDPLFGIIPSEWIVPATVDSLAIIGVMVRTEIKLSKPLRAAATVMLIIAGGLSVAANVATADNAVEIVVGVWTVAVYILAEWFVSKMDTHKDAQTPTPAVTPGAPVKALSVKRDRRCLPGCTCGKHRARRTVQVLEQAYAMPAVEPEDADQA